MPNSEEKTFGTFVEVTMLINKNLNVMHFKNRQ